MIREHDMFGHVINLNFDRRGDSHKTLCGGVFSIVLKSFLVFYVYLKFDMLIYNGNDTNFSYEGQLDLDVLGDVDYSTTNMKFFHVIQKQQVELADMMKEVKSFDVFSKYFKMTYVQKINDFNKMEFTESRVNVHECKEEDFGNTTKSKELFDSWKGFYLACPDLDADNPLILRGDPSAMESKVLGVKFEICNSDDCASDKLEWLKDLQIDTWVLEEMIDYLKYEGRPTKLIQRRLTTNTFGEKLVAKITPKSQLDIIKNEFYMEDDFF